MRWKTLAAAAMLAAFAVMPLSASAQDTGNTDQVQIFTTMPQPEQGYATTLYRVIPVSDQPAFITWISGFQPEQQVLVIRTLHAYSMGGPNVTTFTTDTTPDVAMPVFVNVLGPTDQPNFRNFWGTLTPEQQTAFVTYARDVYTNQTQGDQGTMFGSIQEPERGYATMVYNRIPTTEQSSFMTWLNGFTPDQQLLVIRALHGYSMAGPDVTTFTTDTTPDMAMPTFVKVVGTENETPFTTFWGTLTPVQQTSFVTYARYLGPQGNMNMGNQGSMGNQGNMGNQQTTTVTTTNETSMTSGAAGQPMSTIALNMATTFAPFLPDADRTTFTNMASNTPPAELGGMEHFLSTLTPEQAGMVVRMISKLNEMGMSGTHMANQKGISDYDAKKLLTAQLDSGDMTGFESMYSGMDDQQRTTLLQLARDAYNGGLNDLGATMTSSGG